MDPKLKVLFKSVFFILVVTSVIFGAVQTGRWYTEKQILEKAKATSERIVPPGHIRPPADWLAEYDRFVVLRDELARLEKEKGIQDLRDRVEGISVRLGKAIDGEHYWNEETRTFAPKMRSIGPTPEPVAPPTKQPPTK